MQQPELSSCSCSLAPGEWGESGWHFYRVTVDSFVRSALLHEESHRNGRPFSDADRARCRRDAESKAHHYVGQPVAFAPCQQYRDAVERSIQSERRAGTAQAQDRGRLRVHV